MHLLRLHLRVGDTMDIITYALCKKADREIIDMIHDMEGMTV